MFIGESPQLGVTQPFRPGPHVGEFGRHDPSSQMLGQFDQSNDGQRHAGDHHHHGDRQEQPIVSFLAFRLRNAIPEDLIISAIRLEGDIEEVAQEWNSPRQRFDSHIHQHAGDGNARDAQLNGAHDDEQRHQREK